MPCRKTHACATRTPRPLDFKLPTPAIHIDDLHKRASSPGTGRLQAQGPPCEVHAVQGVNLRAAESGRITGLLGANGAGKTTTLRVLAGLFRRRRTHQRGRHRRAATTPRRAGSQTGILGAHAPLPAPHRAREHRLLPSPVKAWPERRQRAAPRPPVRSCWT